MEEIYSALRDVHSLYCGCRMYLHRTKNWNTIITIKTNCAKLCQFHSGPPNSRDRPCFQYVYSLAEEDKLRKHTNTPKGKPLVPALFIFGDSTVDVGNNNFLPTIVRANFFPYGKDFINHYPTGRFSNGKLAIDFASERFGFITYQPAYLGLHFKEKNILNGANFASAASGYHDSTANLYHVLTLSNQLEYYKDYLNQLIRTAGRSQALSIIAGGIYIVSVGSVDFMMNYYINPCLKKVYTPHQFADILVQNYANIIKSLYALGARRIGVVTLTAIGCFPTTIFLFGSVIDGKCVVDINNVAIYFNQKLNSTSVNLRKILPGLNLILLDSYQPLYNLATKPSEYGFSIAKHGCLGVWSSLPKNATSIFNDQKTHMLCPNASKYVFFDVFHPTEAANKVLAAALIADSIPLVS